MDAELKNDPELRFFTNQVVAEMAVALGLGLVTRKELSGGGPEQIEETLEAALQTSLGIIGVIPREVSDAEVKELDGEETSYAFMPEGSKATV